MTDIATKRGMDKVEIPRSILTFINLIFMAMLLWGSINLLEWACDNKFARAKTVETSNITAEFREHQLGCLAKNIYYEAGSEPFEGKVAVAQVTMNRVNSGQFPNDVCKTIYQKSVIYEKVICQFSWACDRTVKFNPINKPNYNESMIAAQKVLLEDYRLPGLQEALYYHADYINPNWGKQKVAKIGHHIFYK
jgi:spore germination cell wall hydrolase CwlJ-like protein